MVTRRELLGTVGTLAAASALGREDVAPAEVPLAVALVRRAVETAAEVAAPSSEAGREALTRLYRPGE
jgi:hypothetical protein